MNGKTFIAEMEKIKENQLSFFYNPIVSIDFSNPDIHAGKISGRDQYGKIWELFFEAGNIESCTEIELCSECVDDWCEPSLENIYRELWHDAIERLENE